MSEIRIEKAARRVLDTYFEVPMTVESADRFHEAISELRRGVAAIDGADKTTKGPHPLRDGGVVPRRRAEDIGRSAGGDWFTAATVAALTRGFDVAELVAGAAAWIVRRWRR